MRIMFFVFLLFVVSCDSSENPSITKKGVGNDNVVVVTYESAKENFLKTAKIMGEPDFFISKNIVDSFENALKTDIAFPWRDSDDTMLMKVTSETRDAYYVWRKQAIEKSKK